MRGQNFENDSDLVKLWANWFNLGWDQDTDFLRPPTLTASNFEALEIEYLLYRYGVGHNPLLWRNWLHHLLSADMHRNYNIKSHLHLQIFYNSSNE